MDREPGADRLVVLPDSASGVGARRLFGGRELLAYGSGRPCLIADPGPAPAAPSGNERFVSARAGPVALAVIGDTAVSPEQVRVIAARIRRLDDVDTVAERISGSFHVVAVVGDEARFQGTASGLRRVYYTRLGAEFDHAVVMAGGARELAEGVGADLSTEALALHLLPRVPSALSVPLWKGIRSVAPGSAACLGPEGIRIRPWWTVPEAELSLAEGAPAFSAALERAVATRARAGAMACDLSGGLDSTPLSFLADALARRTDGRLITFSQESGQPGLDDADYRRRALEHLSSTHVTARFGELPAWFARAARPVHGLDEPLLTVRSLARVTATAELLGGQGAAVHLTGHGGDEVTHLPLCYLHDLSRTHPRALWPHLRAARARKRWPIASCAHALSDRSSYGTWLAAQGRLLTSPLPARNRPDFGWEMPLRLPSFATRAAAQEVQRHLDATAEHISPYSRARAQHQCLSTLRANAADYAALGRLTARSGATMRTPYLDDQVITAALSVRIDHRSSPVAFKPLTVAAMGSHVPPRCLERGTKDDFSAEFYAGFRAHQNQLLALAEDSALARHGLADAERLRLLCAHTPTRAGGFDAVGLDIFIAVENWLRAVEDTPSSPRRRGEGG
ncbi:asparagine synthase-related protein [Streptomyces sp. NPDC050560]|uniref:asparagine synthase-related protein n=1 Tax=Streptomyces sp. NPDC050560 TaxID=3365630 RepID=UPI0037A2449F